MSTIKRQNSQFFKNGQKHKKTNKKEDIEMNYKHLKRCSITLVIMKIKITIIKQLSTLYNYYFIYTSTHFPHL